MKEEVFTATTTILRSLYPRLRFFRAQVVEPMRKLAAPTRHRGPGSHGTLRHRSRATHRASHKL